MKHFPKHGLISLLVLVLLPFLSCKKEGSKLDVDKTISANTNDVLKYIKSLGFKDSEIIDLGEEYLVDGDILFPYKYVNGSSQKANHKTSQYSTANLVGMNITNISINVDASMSSYISEVNSAIALWNSVPNCRLKFIIWNGIGTPNITIFNNNSTQYCGAANFPKNGQPGSIVRISIHSIATYSWDFTGQLISVIAHELGHAIGFRHTNWISENEPKDGTISPGFGGARFNAMQIIGTPTGNDASSIMNGRTCGIAPTTLSNFDVLAIQFMYPENPPVSGSVPVFRYVGSDHYYTTSYSDLGDGNNDGWIFEGVGFFAFPTAVSGTVPVYEYYNYGNKDHFYTTTLGSYSGYTYFRVAFYAYTSQVSGSIPISRYYNGQDHFYTKNADEFHTGMGGYYFETIAFYAH